MNQSELASILRATATPSLFASYATCRMREPYQIYSYIDYIEKKLLQAIADAQTAVVPPILLIELPPRFGKSEYFCRYFPSWFIGTYPDYRVLLAMNGESIAQNYGRMCRNLMKVYGKSLFGIELASDSHSAGEWRIAGREGGMFSVGVGSAIGGRGANCLIIDDPVRKAEEVLQESQREKMWGWLEAEALRRLEPRSFVVVISTRWHKDDIIGRLFARSCTGEGMPVRRIRLPALAEADDPLGREIGASLCPHRFSTERLEFIKRTTSPAYWNALYQQNPTDHEGAEWPSEYFDDDVIWADGPHANGGWPRKNEFHQAAMSMDPAEGKAKGDYTAILFGGSKDGILYVDSIIERQPIETAVGKAIDMYLLHRPSVLACEINMHRSLIAREFGWQAKERKMIPPRMRLITSKENKENRIRTLGSLFRDKKVRFRDTKSNRLLVQQLREFPLSQHDDGPDALEMLVDTFYWLHGNDAAGDRHTVDYAEV